MVFTFLQLGRVDYQEALAVQKLLVSRRKQGTVGDTVLLLEHPPVLTLGRNARRENILASSQALDQDGVAIVETDRGGDVTYHGPGQLVGYPILDLRGFTPRLGAVDYVRKLEEVLIRACADYGILTARIPTRTGVWTMAGGSVREKKIAAIGVHVSQGITSHGFALNLTADLRHFAWIVPCGIAGRGVTSVEEEIDLRSHPLPGMEEFSYATVRHFGRVFGAQTLWSRSLEELLGANTPPFGHSGHALK